MSKGAILHIFNWDKKFFYSFRDFVLRHFPSDAHRFIVYGDTGKEGVVDAGDTVVYSRSFRNFPALSMAMGRADKVILHGLFEIRLYYALSLQPWILRKCYWNIWGGDLYVHQAGQQNRSFARDEFFRRMVIRSIGHVISCVRGDYELAQQWYGAKGQFHRCIMYPSNLFTGSPKGTGRTGTLNIQVGNSADASNNHFEVFEQLRMWGGETFNVYVPLSYGDMHHASAVIRAGEEAFGERFFPITRFMALDQYLEFLEKIDIAIFAHRRQQGMGNMINLLGLGKKVYMRKEVTTWQLFEEIGVAVFDVAHIELERLDDEVRRRNQQNIAAYFTERRLRDQWEAIFRS